MEEEADTFASCFLVSTDDVKPYFAERRVDLRLLAALKPEWKVSMGSPVLAAKRAGVLNETEAQYIWKQFNIQKIRLRELPELDVPVEEPRTLSDLISLQDIFDRSPRPRERAVHPTFASYNDAADASPSLLRLSEFCARRPALFSVR
nr:MULTISPECIES: ImmA/IrrE family metallo-endopeptidase [Bradyrhizobium]